MSAAVAVETGTDLPVISGIAELTALVGTVLGTTPWTVIDQARVNAFADATDDHQWIHLDQVRAEKESPYGGTVAHGLLTLSLLPWLASRAFRVEGVSARFNYGMESVRFPAPLPVGRSVRGVFKLLGVEPRGEGRHLITIEATVEIEGGDRPVCVARMLAIYAG